MRHIQSAIERLLGETDAAMHNKLKGGGTKPAAAPAKPPTGKIAGPNPAAEAGLNIKHPLPDANALRAKGDNDGVSVTADAPAHNPTAPSGQGAPLSDPDAAEDKAEGNVPDDDDGLMDADGKRDDPVANMLKRLGSKPARDGSREVTLPSKGSMGSMPRPKKGGHKLPKMEE